MDEYKTDQVATGTMTHDALSYCAWAYDRLRMGDTRAAKELLHMGLKRAQQEDIKAPKRYQSPKVSKPAKTASASPAPGGPPKGGTTARVWAIADAALDEHGSGDIKALRAAIISTCEAEGINKSTAGTQYSKWKRAKNIS